jgi:hypothetical protein
MRVFRSHKGREDTFAHIPASPRPLSAFVVNNHGNNRSKRERFNKNEKIEITIWN